MFLGPGFQRCHETPPHLLDVRPPRLVAIGRFKAVISGMNRRKIKAVPPVRKVRQMFDKLPPEILSGKYAPGQKFPSEAALVQQFGTSRITVGRALRELSQRGLVERVAGSGTYVGRGHVSADSLLFGLLIPDLGTSEIFEPICQGIAAAPTASRHGLLWGHVAAGEAAPEEQALGLCEQFIARKTPEGRRG